MVKNKIRLSCKEDDGWRVTLYRLYGTADEVRNYLVDKIPVIAPYRCTLPFTDEETVENEFQLKSRYRGQSFVRMPAHVEENDNGTYSINEVKGLDGGVVNAYIVIDKRKVKYAKRANKKLDKEQILDVIVSDVADLLVGFYKLSEGEMYQCTIEHDGNEVQSIDYIPKGEIDNMEEYILDKLSTVNPTVDRLIHETLTTIK